MIPAAPEQVSDKTRVEWDRDLLDLTFCFHLTFGAFLQAVLGPALGWDYGSVPQLTVQELGLEPAFRRLGHVRGMWDQSVKEGVRW